MTGHCGRSRDPFIVNVFHGRCGSGEGPIVEMVGMARNRVDETICKWPDLMWRHIAYNDHELIASHTCDNVVASKLLLQSFGYFDQEDIARAVAIAIVHLLEAVQVDTDQSHLSLTVQRYLTQRLIHALPVEDSRQGIMLSQMHHFFMSAELRTAN